MVETRLFGNRINPACVYCENAIQNISRDKMVLCVKKGVVPPLFSCRAYRYDPLKREPGRSGNQKYEKEDFEI